MLLLFLKMIWNCIWHNQDWSPLQQTESEKPLAPLLLYYFRNLTHSFHYAAAFRPVFVFIVFFPWKKKLMSKKVAEDFISHLRSFSSRFYSNLTFFLLSLFFVSLLSAASSFMLPSFFTKFNFNVDLLYHLIFFHFLSFFAYYS